MAVAVLTAGTRAPEVTSLCGRQPRHHLSAVARALEVGLLRGLVRTLALLRGQWRRGGGCNMTGWRTVFPEVEEGLIPAT